jgi:hypothetical protein
VNNGKTTNNLFVDTGYRSDVVLNWYGHSIEKLDLYAEAYHSAAKVIVEKASGDQLRDIGATPIVFLYRHSLELWLKAILISGFRLHGDEFETIEAILKKGHNLTKLLQAFKLLCKRLNWKWNSQYRELEAIVSELQQIDQCSASFRYPVELSGQPAIKQNFSFDLQNFCARMDEILLFLDQTDCALAGMLDAMQELR